MRQSLIAVLACVALSVRSSNTPATPESASAALTTALKMLLSEELRPSSDVLFSATTSETSLGVLVTRLAL